METNSSCVTGKGPLVAENVGPSERAISLLAGTWMVVWALARARPLSLFAAVTGGALLRRGVTGKSALYRALQIDTQRPGAPYAGVDPSRAVLAEAWVTIDRPVGELYEYWRRLQNLPQFMTELDRVTRLEKGGWRWIAEGPFGRPIEWEAEVTQDIELQRIAWRSREGSVLPNEGWVEFHPTTRGGTEVWVRLYQEPIGGELGAWFGRLVGRDPQRMLARDLARLKQILEWRPERASEQVELASVCEAWLKVEPGLAGVRQRIADERTLSIEDRVDYASDESFPASDPPGRY